MWPAPWRRFGARTRSAMSTPATTTWRPRATTPSGASTSARSAQRRCSASSASCSAPSSTAVSPLARDRRRHRLLLAQPASGGRRRGGDLHGHLPGNGPDAERQRRSGSGSTSRPPAPRRRRCRSRTRASTSSSGHAVLHHLPDLEKAFSEFHRVLAPGREDRVRRRALPRRRPDRGGSQARRAGARWRRCWRGASRARRRRPLRPRRRLAPTSVDHELERLVDIHAFAPAISSAPRAPRRLRARSRFVARSWWRTGSAGSTARSRPARTPTTCRCSGAATHSTATSRCSASTSACSSRCCRRRSSTTCCSRRAARRRAAQG